MTSLRTSAWEATADPDLNKDPASLCLSSVVQVVLALQFTRLAIELIPFYVVYEESKVIQGNGIAARCTSMGQTKYLCTIICFALIHYA